MRNSKLNRSLVIFIENFILFKLLKIKYHYVSHRKTHKIQRNKITLASPSIPFSQTVSIIFHPEVPDIHKVDLSSNFISSQFLTTFIPLLFSVGGIYIGYISVVDNFYIPGKVLLFLILGLMAFAFAFRLIWDFKEFQEEEEESKYRYNPSENNFSGIDLKNAIEKEKEDISISLDETHSKNKNVNIPNFRMTLGNGNENLKVLFSTISIGLGLLFWGLGALLIVNWNAEIYYELFVIIVFGIGLIVYGANYRRNHEESFVAINSKGIAAHIREKVEVDISKDVGIRNLGILKLLFVKRSYTSFEFKWVEIKNIDFGTSEIQIHTKYNTKRIVPLSQLTYSKKNKIKSAIREAIRNSKENQSLTA